MSKRGQVTIFIVVGILILGAVGGMIYLSKDKIKSDLVIQRNYLGIDTTPVKLFVEDCLKKTINEGMYYLGLQGGYYNLLQVEHIKRVENTNPNNKSSLLKTPFYFYKGKEIVPKKDTFEKELAKYIEKNLILCTNFEVFKDKGYSIQTDATSAKVSLGKNIKAEVKFPVKVTQRNEVKELNHFIKIIDYNFMDKYNLMSQILEEQKKDTQRLPLGKILSLAEDNDFDYYLDYRNSSVIVDLVFDDYLKEKPFIYSFSLRYDWENLSNLTETTKVQEIKITPLPKYKIKKPGIFGLMLSVSTKNLVFKDNCDWFDIESDGWFEFETKGLKEGNYSCSLTATNNKGDKDEIRFEFEIY